MSPPKVLALDLEGTLISNAVSQIPRPGLFDFLTRCRDSFSRIVMFTTVSEKRFRDIAGLLVKEGFAPTWFADIEYVVWNGPTKDLRFIRGVAPSDVVLVDDYADFIHPGQEGSWEEVEYFGPPYASDDEALARTAQALRARVERRSRR